MKQLPSDFCSRISATHADADALLSAIDTAPALSVRFNDQKPQPDNLPTTARVSWCPSGCYLSERPLFTLLPSLHGGAFYVQEASSMFLEATLTTLDKYLPANPLCLDLCAAPGGKSTLLMSHFVGRGLVWTNEVVRNRAWILRENVAKWGLGNALVSQLTPEQIAAADVRVDLLVVDAPCSGEGMFRKDDVAIAEWSASLAQRCADRQKEILQTIWPCLRSGGFLVYSTCTFNPAENEANMQWAVEHLHAECLTIDVSQWTDISQVAFKGGEGYAFYPHKVRGEGFFLCLLRKTDEADKPMANAKNKQKIQNIAETSDCADWIGQSAQLFGTQEAIFALPTFISGLQLDVLRRIPFLLTGIPVATILTKQGKKLFSPAPELALSVCANHNLFEKIDVDTTQALKFLHGDADIGKDGKAGWCLVSYDGLPLGFVKQIGMRQNNYFPKEWRIKMNIPVR